MTTLTNYCQTGLASAEAAHLRRTLRASDYRGGAVVEQEGRAFVSFSCNDYLGLRDHPGVIAAAQGALAEYGTGAGASRLVTGNHPLYAPLERKLAAGKKAEAALVFGSGYLTNIGVIPALVGKGDVIFADKLVHACIIDAARLSGAKLVRFAHNDMGHLEQLLRQWRGAPLPLRERMGEGAQNEATLAYPDNAPPPSLPRKGGGTFNGNALIVTDHVFSMDGDVAPLAEIAALAKAYDAWTMVDDAHGLGIVPAAVEIDVWMGTLSKAAAGYGGYVIGTRALIDFLVSHARSLVFSTGLPPASCAAALAALEVMEAEPERREKVMHHAQRVSLALGLGAAQSAIVPVVMGSAEAALAASVKLKEVGILAPAIRPPTVPVGTARLRLAFSAAHTDAQVDRLIAAVKTL